MVLCRHGCIRPNGAVNLKGGEKLEPSSSDEITR